MEATGDLVGNENAGKITEASKTDKNELEIPKKRDISPEEIKQIIDQLRLI